MKISKKMLLYCLCLMVVTPLVTEENGVFIVHKDVPIETLTRSELQKIYQGKTTHWNNNVKIQPVYITGENPLGSRFFKIILDMTPDGFNSYWARKLFAGYGTPPKNMVDGEAVLDYVSRKPGSIGFIPSSSKAEARNCKPIKIETQDRF